MPNETVEATTVVVNPPTSEQLPTSLMDSSAVELGRVLERMDQMTAADLERQARLETMERTQRELQERQERIDQAIEQARRQAVAEAVVAAAVLDEESIEADEETEVVTPEPEPEVEAEPEPEPKKPVPWLMKKLLGE